MPADGDEKDTGTAAAGESATLTYAAIAASRWFLPASHNSTP